MDPIRRQAVPGGLGRGQDHPQERQEASPEVVVGPQQVPLGLEPQQHHLDDLVARPPPGLGVLPAKRAVHPALQVAGHQRGAVNLDSLENPLNQLGLGRVVPPGDDLEVPRLVEDPGDRVDGAVLDEVRRGVEDELDQLQLDDMVDVEGGLADPVCVGEVVVLEVELDKVNLDGRAGRGRRRRRGGHLEREKERKKSESKKSESKRKGQESKSVRKKESKCKSKRDKGPLHRPTAGVKLKASVLIRLGLLSKDLSEDLQWFTKVERFEQK